MRNLRILMGLSFSVVIVALMTVSARPAVEMVQTPTPDELAELMAIRPVPGKNGLYLICLLYTSPSPRD